MFCFWQKTEVKNEEEFYRFWKKQKPRIKLSSYGAEFQLATLTNKKKRRRKKNEEGKNQTTIPFISKKFTMRNSIKTRKKTKANFYKLRKELRSNHHHTTYKTKKTNNKYVNTPPSTEQIFYSALSHPRQSVGFITVHRDGVLDFLCGFDSTENDPVLLFFFLLLLFSFFRLPLSKLFFQQNKQTKNKPTVKIIAKTSNNNKNKQQQQNSTQLQLQTSCSTRLSLPSHSRSVWLP